MKPKTNWTVLKENLLKSQTDFLIKKVTAGSVTIVPDPDPTWPKRSGFTTLIYPDYATTV
jgi:hypothetical protein